jgi:hypothetical protein
LATRKLYRADALLLQVTDDDGVDVVDPIAGCSR